ncbi:U3 small nucleolar RNA-associated protein 6-domain-containing protein [Gilbertella persicaria]|uniref:U3 small nucleolar RNA-associated protein 6-domain-containing protein n=1 Tax=Gilbertella persicaria TaxID=101096 RepID=UPI00222020DB|nr:U3 small nucleolar RNA-associated protein 6-domain-containing protein [Gilbertella persicaria]KAI8059410.1 U3 small nucleolar RNA-associated protein 6-domain-containing protein [Gilbertella persicaria]
MAESVQYYLERMIPELEGLEKKHVFSSAEIKSIIKKRTNFEYALHRRIKQKIDFLRAIEYETNLEELRQKRVARMGLKDGLKGDDLQYSGARRIYGLFRRATIKFKNDLSLWLQYIDYAKRNKANNILSSVFVQAIQHHPHNASLWIMAATWEHEENANVAAARVLLQRALRLMPENQSLWHEYFRLELIYIEKIKLRRRLLGINQPQTQTEDVMDTDNTIQLPALTGEDVAQWKSDENKKTMTEKEAAALEEANNPILQGLLAKIVYDNAIQAIPNDIGFRQRFIDVYREFTEMETQIDHVYDTMQRDLYDQPEARRVLASRHMTGSLKVSDPAFVPALRACVQDFEKAVADLNMPTMWQLYIEFLLNWRDLVTEENLRLYLTKLSQKTLKACQKEGQMNAKIYALWMPMLIETDKEKAETVAERGTEMFPDATPLWLYRIQLAATKESLYWKALALNPGSLVLWRAFIDWIMHGNLSTQDIDRLFYKACEKVTMLLPSATSSEPSEIKQLVQSRYVEWTAASQGIEATRTVYRKIIKGFYPTFGFYMKCVELENQYGTGDQQGKASVEYLYEQVTRMEDHKEETYISYLAYLYSQKKFQKANQVYHRACHELPNKEALDLQIQKLRK